jgi:hypothetical protein
VNLFIKQEKILGSLLDANPETRKASGRADTAKIMSLGLVFLVEYAKLFQRHCPPEFLEKFYPARPILGES